MPILKHLNHDYDTGIPKATGDRYYSQDLLRDFWYLLDKAGVTIKDIFNSQTKVILSGGVVSNSATQDCIDISACIAYTKFAVTIPDTFAALPPSTMAADVDMVRINVTAQVAFSLITSGANGDGSTPNYIKIKYAETDGNTRSRAKKAGTYSYEKVPSFTVTCDDDAPTAYEVCLGIVTWNSTSHARTVALTNRDFTVGRLYHNSQKALSADYTVLDNEGYNTFLVTTSSSDRTVTLPTLADNQGRIITVKKVDTGSGKVIIDGEGSETIDGQLTQELFYNNESIQFVGTSSEWKILNKVKNAVLILSEETSSGVALANVTSGSWQQRVLNTVRTNTITGASLNTNVFTLPAGVYKVRAYSPHFSGQNTRARIYNTSDSAVVSGSVSINGYGATSWNHVVPDVIECIISITASKNFQIESYSNQTLGMATGSITSTNEVGTTVFIEKIA